MKIANLENNFLLSLISDIYKRRFQIFYKPEIPDLNCLIEKPILSELLRAFISSNHYEL